MDGLNCFNVIPTRLSNCWLLVTPFVWKIHLTFKKEAPLMITQVFKFVTRWKINIKYETHIGIQHSCDYKKMDSNCVISSFMVIGVFYVSSTSHFNYYLILSTRSLGGKSIHAIKVKSHFNLYGTKKSCLGMHITNLIEIFNKPSFKWENH
jgi:hypothetical protein